MHRIKTSDLQLILLAKRERSLTAIGQNLGISQSAVSQRLDKLEKELKLKLIYRGARSDIELTPDGENLYRFAAHVEREYKNYEKQADASRKGNDKLSIIAVPSVILDDTAEIIYELRQKFPSLEITINEGNAQTIVDSVLQDKADFGLIGKRRAIAGLDVETYRNAKVVLLVHKQHALARQREIAFKNTLHYPYISLPSTNVMGQMMEAAQALSSRGNASETRYITRSIEAPNLEIAAQYASKGIGIAMTLDSVAMRYVDLNDATMLNLTDPWAQAFPMNIIWKTGSYFSAAKQSFLDKLMARFARTR